MVIERGQIWWADLDEPDGSGPGYRRPVLVVQSDFFNRSRLHTVVVVLLTSNLRRVDAPGNVFIPAASSGLPEDSVVSISQIVAVDRDFLTEPVAQLRGALLKQVDDSLRLLLNL